MTDRPTNGLTDLVIGKLHFQIINITPENHDETNSYDAKKMQLKFNFKNIRLESTQCLVQTEYIFQLLESHLSSVQILKMLKQFQLKIKLRHILPTTVFFFVAMSVNYCYRCRKTRHPSSASGNPCCRHFRQRFVHTRPACGWRSGWGQAGAPCAPGQPVWPGSHCACPPAPGERPPPAPD